MNRLMNNQKQAWANLKKRPGFFAAVVATMGITLGTLLCVLTLAYILIVSPLPYPKQEQLYRLDNIFIKGADDVFGNYLIYPAVVKMHKDGDIFTRTTLTFDAEGVIESDPEQPRVYTNYVTPDWFPLLGAKAVMGRVFTESEALDTNNPVVVLSYDSWQRVFGGDADILERKFMLGGVSFSIVGVLADSFIEPQIRNDGQKSDVFLPWDFNPIKPERGQSWRSPHPNITLLGSLGEDMTKQQAEQKMTASVNEIWQSKVVGVDFWQGYRVEIQLRQLKAVILGDFKKTVYLLLAAVISLVLIALANISNLFISRTAEQQRELAIRAALGANSTQLFYNILAETALLMSISVIIAVAIAQAGFELLQHFFALALPRVNELSINAFTLISAVLIVAVLALFFAWLGSKMINYRELKASLHSSGKGAGIQVSKTIRKLLILSQVAVASALIFMNISIFKESVSMISQPLGFDTRDTYLLRLNTNAQSAEEIVITVNEISKKLQALPSVREISQAYSPLNTFDLISYTSSQDGENTMVEALPIDDKYFSLIGQTLIAGDNVKDTDVRDGNKVVVVNDAYAKKLAPNGTPIGMRLTNDEKQAYVVVGVVKGITIPGKRDVPMRAYAPFGSDRYRLQILMKLLPGKKLSNDQLIDIVNNVDSRIWFHSQESFDDRRSELLFGEFVTVITSSALTAISYLLAAIGLYGVLSYSTQMRRYEIGTRLAIGAKRRDLISMIVKDNTAVIAGGIVSSIMILICIYLGFSGQLSNFINFTLLPTFAVTLLLVVSISFFACYWPLRRFINRPTVYCLKGD